MGPTTRAPAISSTPTPSARRKAGVFRQLLYLGLNEDEAERIVFDGVLVHIAGGKRGGDFNMRFGQPSASLPSDPFPFNEMGATDPVSGRSDGLLERLACAIGCRKSSSPTPRANIGGVMPR